MKKIFILLSMVVCLASCSTYDYYAVSNKPVTTNRYQTYAWIPESQSKTTSIYNNDIATDRIVEATNAELDKRGFQLNNNKPDLLIRYTAVVNKETKTVSDPVYYNPPSRLSPRVGYYRGRARFYYAYTDPFPVYVGSRARKMQVKAGSIMIDIIERKTSKLIWRGWAEGEVNDGQKAINDIPTVIANIFKKLP
ncbi:DUF4136 domain-containing protein [Pedobacter sp. Hv1]|uniref:DUF4136 domain-containing protein n=1 Tax=Pedobacter sp. Hv1 TaxID=1740090 RepID=UPI0006D8BD75|nr:DUF4136 domain-containing protein [Pedobacter sp. Hv1]KQC00471.1 hypothetical protein AQF98_13435 [Pedobacter sp. Hv1]